MNSVEFLSAADIAPRLGVGVPRVYQLFAAGRLPIVRHGHRILVPVRAWERWLELNAEIALGGIRERAPYRPRQAKGKGADHDSAA
jgi:excisionase family DNA binding protein